MGKKPIKPERLKRVWGLSLLSMGIGMLLGLILSTFSIFWALIFLISGFYLLFL